MSNEEPSQQPAPRSRVERVSHNRKEVLQNPRFATATPHRCNEHLEDVLNGLRDETWTWRDWRASMGTFLQCVRSPVGEEPARFNRADDNQ